MARVSQGWICKRSRAPRSLIFVYRFVSLLLFSSYYGWGFLYTTAVLFGSVSIVRSCIEFPQKGSLLLANSSTAGPGRALEGLWPSAPLLDPDEGSDPDSEKHHPRHGERMQPETRREECLDGRRQDLGTRRAGTKQRKSRAERALNHPKPKLADTQYQCRARLGEIETNDTQEARAREPTCKQTTPKKHAHTSWYICPDQH